MTKREILRNRLAMAEQNVLCYSSTQAMDTPRPGYEKEWAAAKEEADTICEMIGELISGDPDNESITVRGTIDRCWYAGSCVETRKPFVFFKVKDRDGNRRILAARYDVGDDLMRWYNAERHGRCKNTKSDQAVFHVDENGLVIRWRWIN